MRGKRAKLLRREARATTPKGFNVTARYKHLKKQYLIKKRKNG